MKKISALIITIVISLFMTTGCSFNRIFEQYKYADADMYTAGNTVIDQKVKNITVDWTSGSVEIKTHSEDTIVIEETSDKDLSEQGKVHWAVIGDTLNIKHSRSSVTHYFSSVSKALTIIVPESMIFDSVKIDTAAASVDGYVKANEVSIYTASGAVNLVSETSYVVIDTASGAIKLSQEIIAKVISVYSASGSVSAKLYETPEILNLDTASGSVALLVPENAGFTADIDTASGSVNCKIPVQMSAGKYVAGDGTARFYIDTASGSVTISGIEGF